jgi:hypothetical protein
MFPLLIAALAMASQAVVAADSETSRSVGAYPVVYDDYPESELSINVGDDIVLTVTGEARTRFEWVENGYDFSSNGFEDDSDDEDFDDSLTFAPARFVLGFRVDLPRDVAAVVELQSAFEFGDDNGGHYWDRVNVNQHLRPGALNRPGVDTFDGEGLQPIETFPGSVFSGFARDSRSFHNPDDVVVYQAYIEAAKIGGSIASLRFGRQELAYGTEFMLGNQDFYDGLSYDGLKLILDINEKNRLDLFWAKLAESQVFGDGSDNDMDLYGAYYSLSEMGHSTVGFDAYALAYKDRANLIWELETFDDFTVDSGIDGDSDDSFVESYWLGVRFWREREHGFHFSAELAYQFGDINADFVDADGDDATSVDISGWAMESFLGYTWDTPTNPTIKGGLTWASGSDFDDYDGGNWNTFFTPASEIHPRLGLADQVEASNIVAWNLGYTGSKDKHSWGVDLWYFDLDEVDPEVNDEVLSNVLEDRDGEGLDEHLGEEIDLWYTYQYSKNMSAQFALAWFSAGDYIEQINRCVVGGCDEDLDSFDEDDEIRTSDALRAYINLLLRW